MLKTAFELLSESGVGGFTIDEVTRHSGVAKTINYQQWPTRAAVVIGACSRITAKQQVRDTLDALRSGANPANFPSMSRRTINW